MTSEGLSKERARREGGERRLATGDPKTLISWNVNGLPVQSGPQTAWATYSTGYSEGT